MNPNEHQNQPAAQPVSEQVANAGGGIAQSRKPSTPIINAVIGLIVLGSGLYFLARPSPAKSPAVSNQAPSATSTQAAAVPYRYGMDKELLFSIPAGWFPHEKHGWTFLLKAPNTPDLEGTETYAYGDQVTISDSNLTDDKGNRLTRAQYDAFIKKNPPATKDVEGNLITRTDVTINGIKMTKIDQLEYAGSHRTLTYEILKGDLRYEIRLFPYYLDDSDAIDVQNIADLEALIQSVRFAN